LSLARGVVGLLLATWGTKLLVAYGPADVPRLRDVTLDRYVLFFTLSVSTLTGILFGVAPAVITSRTLDISLLLGRVFTDADTENSPQVIVVSNAFVKRYLSNEDPIGKRIIFDGERKIPREIVGVVEDIRR
jgi:MacB-like protein